MDGPKVLIRVSLVLAAATLSWGVDLAQTASGVFRILSVYEKRDGMRNVLIGFVGLVLLPGLCPAADKMELKNESERINYSVGYQIGGDFKSQGVELNPEMLGPGDQDALNKNEPLLSPEQMNATLVNLKKKLVADQQVTARQAERGISCRERQEGRCRGPPERCAVQGAQGWRQEESRP